MPRHSYTFEALGTHWEISTQQVLTSVQQQAVQALVESFDTTYSRFRNDSLVTEIARHAGRYTFPENAETLFSFYEDLLDISNGKVTPLVGGVLEDLGYDAHYSFQTKASISEAPSYHEVVKREGLIVTTSRPLVFDFGAAGKGYLVDLIGAILKTYGHIEYVIDASGDILHAGTNTERVGLENPFEKGSVIGEVDLSNRALCASATHLRMWGNGLHHVVDPATRLPTNDFVATWAIADSAMIADGLATALFFCDPKKIRKQYTYEYVRIKNDGTAEYSSYFTNALY